ncbi:gluconokinase [Oryzihumus sp.]|jgi:gluconokinase|uniref:gluconokinase n=1 Tax=Oryzihumus sp. TaxID=1968903 RepID=UPI002ED8CB86
MTLTTPPARRPIAVVMGVSGSGKTTVGQELAARLGVPYADADEFHPPANIAKMSAGVPLDDTDRAPWLRAIAGWLADHRATGAVVSCSALKRRYRVVLRTAVGHLPFLHLDGDPAVVAQRVAGRPGHFMPASLVASQFADLEPLGPDEEGMVADLAAPVDDVVARFTAYLSDHPVPA